MAQVNYNQPPPSGDRDGNAGIYAILIIVVLLILAAVLYFGGVFGGATADEDLEADIDIDQPAEVIEVPDVDRPDVNIEAPNIEIPDTIDID